MPMRTRTLPWALLLAGAVACCTDDPYSAHLDSLRGKLPDSGFHVVMQPPFVVIGDESPEVVERWASGTVQWAVDMLKKDYFTEDPDEILDVWLFKDERSYIKHTEEIFGSRPGTRFGYYSPEHCALIMNIGRGGGTLVHEIVHPYMAANFPECPAWFNEGMGSLYEQSAERDGHIVGLTNWRLPSLQSAINQGPLPSFEALMATTEREFYGEAEGLHYAQARYLCYYLQERGLLRRFYHEFRSARGSDVTGYQTLKAVLGREDMVAFQREWQDWVLTLHFP